GKPVEVDDPWGYGRSLEWATSCPPPRHNFLTLPRIRTESPAFDLHHPDVSQLDQWENVARYNGETAPERGGTRP
ncbi:cytochrome ubiquinol oxidase subunit I, partial [Streptomyces sp. NPDC005047]